MLELLIKIYIIVFLCGFVYKPAHGKENVCLSMFNNVILFVVFLGDVVCFNCNSHYDNNCDQIPRKNLSSEGIRLKTCTGGCAIMKGQWGNENFTLTRRALLWRGCTGLWDKLLCTQHASVCCRCYSNYCNYGIDCTELLATNLYPKMSLIVLSFIVLLVCSFN